MTLDFDDFYGEDYLNIYGPDLDQRTQVEVEFIDSTLNLGSQARILDLFCGYGRHALLLGKLGYEVVGVDTSNYLIETGIRKIEDAKLSHKVTLIKKTKDDISFQNEFDAVINMYTSFGFYESDEDNFSLIKKAYNALKPEGKFLLDVVNRERIITQPRFKNWEERDNGLFLLEAYDFDYLRGRAITRRIILDKGVRKEGYISIRLYTLAELRAALEEVGFEVKNVYGGYNGNLFTTQSPRMIPLCIKK